ncbi:MAG: hypothetical protein HKO68_19365 [Desulfobacterales bacterium]|nr:hypothetical protein [Desulfobacterales bacterium]
MISRFQRMFYIAAIVSLLAAAGAWCVYAQEQPDMKGWGEDDPYNKYYDIREFEKFRGWVLGFKEEPPMEGMSPATILIVRDGSEHIDVHLCPTWFAKPKEVGVKKGDRVKIKGAWAEIDGKDIFMASKVKKGEMFEFKVRLTKNGKPFWIMTPEELATERAPE